MPHVWPAPGKPAYTCQPDFAHRTGPSHRMSLADDLAAARTEEDVKDAYIRALGLTGVRKGWFRLMTQDWLSRGALRLDQNNS